MSNVIEMGFGFSDISQILDLSEFLSNTEALIDKFEPAVSKFLVKKDFFKGPFLREYLKQFDELIKSLIKTELINHYTSWSPEDILRLTEDTDFLKMLAPDLFDQDAYKKRKLN